MSERVSYWLVPAEEDEEDLACIIVELAGWSWDAPTFDPHVTLYSGQLDSRGDVPRVLKSATRGIGDVTLHSTGIAHSDQFTKTLFIEFAGNAVLSQLSRAFKDLSAQPEEYELKPHLSLLYAKLSAESREHFAKTTVVPSRVRFNRVRAIASNGPTRTPEDVSAWRVIAEVRLGMEETAAL